MSNDSQYANVPSKELLLAHYSNPKILAEMVRCSEKKEVVGSYGGVGYARRPDIIEYATDIIELVKKGATSFHASEELWSNPLSISTQLTKGELTNLRTGWDLLLDIDCKSLDYSKIGSHLVVQFLKSFGIKSLSCKFSGNHGFHIAIPFEAFPQTIADKNTKELFPELPRAIAEYIKHILEEKLSQELISYERSVQEKRENEEEYNAKNIADDVHIIKQIATNTRADLDRIFIDGKFLGFEVVGIDTILITSRHLYRQVYSVNEKSGLISIPINPDKILVFDKNIAKIENNIVSRFKFLDRENVIAGEASDFLIQAYDFSMQKKRAQEATKTYNEIQKSENAKVYEQLT